MRFNLFLWRTLSGARYMQNRIPPAKFIANHAEGCVVREPVVAINEIAKTIVAWVQHQQSHPTIKPYPLHGCCLAIPTVEITHHVY